MVGEVEPWVGRGAAGDRSVLSGAPVLRRIDVLADTKEEVLERNAQMTGKLENLDDLLQRRSGRGRRSSSMRPPSGS